MIDNMISTTTPALLFPAITLLLLAYTNRFLVLAQLIRQLNREDVSIAPGSNTARKQQLLLLNKRIGYIKNMQALGIVSFIICTTSMFALFIGQQKVGGLLFGGSLLVLVVSLLFALIEVLASTKALSIELSERPD